MQAWNLGTCYLAQEYTKDFFKIYQEDRLFSTMKQSTLRTYQAMHNHLDDHVKPYLVICQRHATAI